MQPLNRRQILTLLASAPLAYAQTRKPSSLRLSVRDFGAKGDGAAKDTSAIQQALDRCSVLGGGEVLVPAGNYLTGAIALRSNTLLRLEANAVISGTNDFAEYPVTQVRWEGK
jgi:polygalacturonase